MANNKLVEDFRLKIKSIFNTVINCLLVWNLYSLLFSKKLINHSQQHGLKMQHNWQHKQQQHRPECRPSKQQQISRSEMRFQNTQLGLVKLEKMFTLVFNGSRGWNVPDFLVRIKKKLNFLKNVESVIFLIKPTLEK